MENTLNSFEPLFEKAQTYTRSSIDLLKLKTIDATANVSSQLASKLVLVIIATIITVLINIGLALWIGALLQKTYYGFFAVAIFYIIVFAIIYLKRIIWIETPIKHSIINQLLDDK